MTSAPLAKVFDGKLLAKNSLWNLLGTAVPLAVALGTIPLLIRGLGTERFGILTLLWTGIGYFSLFDIGLGQALTKLVAEYIGAGREKEIPSLVWTALGTMTLLGAMGALVVIGLSPWLVHDALKITPALHAESLASFYLLAMSIPLMVCAAGLSGVLEAHQRFDLVNAVRMPLGLYSFVSPLLLLSITRSLAWIVALLVLGRIVGVVAYAGLCLRAFPSLRAPSWDWRAFKPLLKFGGWMTATNIVAPLMIYMDRFLIGILLPMSVIAYYTTPYEVIIRLTLVPVALAGVLFPALSSALVQDRRRAAILFDRGLNYIFLALFPIALAIVMFAQEGLALWLGFDFARQSAAIVRWLTIGVLLNSLARIPFTLIQAQGRPDITTKLYIIELPVYLLMLAWLVRRFGIQGAAMAWTLRVALDSAILFAISARILPSLWPAPLLRSSAILGAGLALFAVGNLANDLLSRTLLLSTLLVSFSVAAWFIILVPQERQFIAGKLSWRRFRS